MNKPIETYKCNSCNVEFGINYATRYMPYCTNCGENDDVVETTDDKSEKTYAKNSNYFT